MNSGLGLNLVIPEHLRGPVTEAQRNEFRGANIFEREDEDMPTDRLRRTGNNNNNTNKPAAVNSSRGRTTSRRAATSGSRSHRESYQSPSSSSSSSSSHHHTFNQFNPFITQSYTPQSTPQPTPQPTQQIPSFNLYFDINDGYGPMDTSPDDVFFFDANTWQPIFF